MSLSSPYRSTQRVYFDDLDALNILHNVRYVLFMERARGELFQALGFRWEDDLATNPDKFHVVAAHEIEYLAPVRGEGELVVELSPSHLGRTSFVIDASVKGRHGDLVYAVGKTRLVRLDPASFKPAEWSERFRRAVEPLVAQTKAVAAKAG
ncbi:MAG: thioesterase family protein [Sandaracinus sp.]